MVPIHDLQGGAFKFSLVGGEVGWCGVGSLSARNALETALCPFFRVAAYKAGLQLSSAPLDTPCRTSLPGTMGLLNV
jgi:hypothetical protein